MVHTQRQVCIRRLYYQMMMITHRTIIVAGPVKAFADLAQYLRKRLVVIVIQKNIAPPLNPQGEVTLYFLS